MDEYTTFEKIGIRNGLNKVVGPFIEKMRGELMEGRMSLDREEPNVELCLRRIRQMEKLVYQLEQEQEKWNMEL
jgi:hypothetical protein